MLAAEIFNICPKLRFFRVFDKRFRGLAQKLLEICAGVAKMFSHYLLSPLMWGSKLWLKIRLIRFLSKLYIGRTYDPS